MSSDSEDDCYGNIAQKLQSIKSKYKEDKIEATNLLDDSFKVNPIISTPSISEKVDKVIEIEDHISQNNREVLKDDSDAEEISLDAIIAKNSKKRVTRSSKRNTDISADNILPTRSRKKSRGCKKSSDSVVDTPDNANSSNQNVNTSSEPVNTPSVATNVNNTRSRGRGRRRGRRGGNTTDNTSSDVNTTTSVNNTSSAATNSVTVNSNIAAVNSINSPDIPTDIDTSSILSSVLSNISRDLQRRGRGRRGRMSTPRRQRRMWIPDFFSFLGASRSQQTDSYPTYNIGNFAEYPDECYNQPLFNNQTAKADDVIVVGENEAENESIDENEELSVKVYWQNRELVKFTIRRFQKLTQIFDFFAKRENVSYDKLLFTYNEKILKVDDTPDSITYSIVKFIDGGIINQSVSKIVQKDRSTAKEGLKLKFQCQNMKKPFEMTVRPDDKMAVAMMMCAEHLEKPLDKLKFHFDGDLITGKSTPRELELEGGECIDVKIIS